MLECTELMHSNDYIAVIYLIVGVINIKKPVTLCVQKPLLTECGCRDSFSRMWCMYVAYLFVRNITFKSVNLKVVCRSSGDTGHVCI